jgi:tripartite-type tricarboxylate transporter receptor subunit TctC
VNPVKISLLRLALGAVAFALAAVAPLASAQDAASYPSRPIKLVCPYPPGALTDLLARAIAQRLSESLKQPVVVENKPGAGTLVGAEFVAKQAPDGYTLLMATSTTLGISPALYAKSPIDPIRDFAPVAQAGAVNFILLASADFPAKTLPELIAEIKRNPGKYFYASVGNGSPHHLFMESLKRKLGLDVQHVPYKGTPQALPDLYSGKVQMMFADFTAALPAVQSGKARALGATSARQSALVPDIAPIATVVPGFDWQAWQGIVTTAGTPKPIVDKLNAALSAMLATPEFKEQLVKFGMDPAQPHSAQQFADVVRADVPRWAEAVKASGATVD